MEPKLANRVTARLLHTVIQAEESMTCGRTEYETNYDKLGFDADEKWGEMKTNSKRPKRKEEIVVKGFGLQLTQGDLETLSPKGLLNDQIMNFYLSLLTQVTPEVYCFDTFFMEHVLHHEYEQYKNWTKNVDIFSFSLVLIPINRAMHWTLAIINFPEESIKFYNSLGPNLYEDCLEALQKFLKAEHNNRKQKELLVDDWQDLGSFIDGPRHYNGYDCGMFVLEMARCLCLKQEVTFSQKEIPSIRQRIREEIMNFRLRC
ncbi:Sentrin-specific protease 1 [Frankliniella fusca]|uniref:Sentrin-specific protease 1 n=1 Tax=Frankliniella fusca TaxID=407009 RepID=A0AAE1LU23_9NEOP|nr:Sentrin-specific protease 1 [Frankliniella fusca]